MKSIFEQNGGTYTQVGDYLIPDISLPDAPAYPIGKYGRIQAQRMIRKNGVDSGQKRIKI